MTEIFNYVFAFIFTMECAIKIIALGKDYFKNGWNVFDFIIVVVAIIGVIISYGTPFRLGPSTTILRSFRIFRIFRLIKKAKSLHMNFTTFMVTLPALANVGGLLVLLLYIYAILGIYLFADIKIASPLHDNVNF